MSFISIFAALLNPTLVAADVRTDGRMLFKFDRQTDAKAWKTVNDGVMGGRSIGRFKLTNKGTMKFYGTLSLKNNGGFASVRTKSDKLSLAKGDSLVVRVRGDGRKFSLNLYPKARLTAFAFRAEFQTKKDKWIEIRIPLDKFVATSFGRVVKEFRLNPRKINGIGFLLGDKKAGPFELEIDWIKVQNRAR